MCFFKIGAGLATDAKSGGFLDFGGSLRHFTKALRIYYLTAFSAEKTYSVFPFEKMIFMHGDGKNAL